MVVVVSHLVGIVIENGLAVVLGHPHLGGLGADEMPERVKGDPLLFVKPVRYPRLTPVARALHCTMNGLDAPALELDNPVTEPIAVGVSLGGDQDSAQPVDD